MILKGPNGFIREGGEEIPCHFLHYDTVVKLVLREDKPTTDVYPIRKTAQTYAGK